MVRITFDPNKRARTLAVRGLDFAEANLVFGHDNVENDDRRWPYGERRVICYGSLRGRLVVVVYTVRGDTRHIISMRKGNARELRRIGPALGL